MTPHISLEPGFFVVVFIRSKNINDVFFPYIYIAMYLLLSKVKRVVVLFYL